MNIEIKNLQFQDLEQYKYLIDECFGESKDLAYYKKCYQENSNYNIIVAKDNHKIIGSVTMYPIDLFTFSFQPALEIFNVAVLKEYRKNGVAKQLFDHVIKYAKENNYQSIYLTCLDTAYGAHHLYESVGFQKMSSIKYSLTIK